MTPGDLVIYRTANEGARPAVFIGYVGSKRVLIRIAGQERTVYLKSLEPL